MERVGRVRIAGKRRHLVLPEVQIALGEFVQVRPIRHAPEYNDAKPA